MGVPRVLDFPPAQARAARQVAQRLASRGFRAWVVGGAVRDLALGLVPKDLDLCSPATPAQVQALFPEAIGVGRAFGTMTLPGFAFPLEVTTFRREGAYADGRRPEVVEFGASLEEDAQRRDFTINALYLDPLSDQLCDPTGGFPDLERRLLRAVGQAERRFAEDRLRVLRLARFAGRFGFEIDAATRNAAQATSGALGNLSAERVASELRGIFARRGFARGAAELEALGVRKSLFDYSWAPAEAAQPAGSNSPGIARLEALERQSPEAPGLALGLCLWWLPGADCAALKPEPARQLAQRAFTALKLAREEARDLEALWLALTEVGQLEQNPAPRAAALRLLRRVPRGAFARLLALESCPLEPRARRRLQALLAAGDEPRLPVLLDGEALADLGIPRGPGMKAWLLALETWQLEGRLASAAEARECVQRCLQRGQLEPPLWPDT